MHSRNKQLPLSNIINRVTQLSMEQIQSQNHALPPHYQTLPIQYKISKIEEKFKKICLLYGEPFSYSHAFLSFLNNQEYETKEEQYKLKFYVISDEIDLIKNGDSVSQKIASKLEEREKVLKKLRSQLIVTRNSKQINLSDCVESLKMLRMYNLAIIESLMNLSKNLRNTDSPYFSEIIDKLSRDLDFLRFSALRKHIQFSSHQDPLFMVPLRRFQNLEANTGYNRKSIVNLFNIEPTYRMRLEVAQKFTKLFSTFHQRQSTQPMDTLQTQIQRNPRRKQRSGLKNNETMKKYNFPSINKNNLNKNAKEDNKKKIVSNVVKEIIEDYGNQQRYKEERVLEKSLRNKPRAQTQALSRSLIFNYSKEDDISKLVGDSQGINKINFKPIDVLLHKKFEEDDDEDGESQYRQNPYYHPYNKMPKQVQTLDLKKVSDRENKQTTTEKQKIRRSISKEGNRAGKEIKKEENYQSQTKNDDNKLKKGENEVTSKVRNNKIRNKQTKLIYEQIKDKPTEMFKQTIYKAPENFHTNEKNIYLSIRNEHNEEEREKTYKDLLGQNQKFMRKIKKIQFMTVPREDKNSSFKNKPSIQKTNKETNPNNERFQNPLDKVQEIRENLDYDSEQEEEKGAQKGRNLKRANKEKSGNQSKEELNKIQSVKQIKRQVKQNSNMQIRHLQDDQKKYKYRQEQDKKDRPQNRMKIQKQFSENNREEMIQIQAEQKEMKKVNDKKKQENNQIDKQINSIAKDNQNDPNATNPQRISNTVLPKTTSSSQNDPNARNPQGRSRNIVLQTNTSNSQNDPIARNPQRQYIVLPQTAKKQVSSSIPNKKQLYNPRSQQIVLPQPSYNSPQHPINSLSFSNTPPLSNPTPPLQFTNQQQLEQQKIEKQSMNLLQKCTFVSKSMRQEQIFKQLQETNAKNYEQLKSLINGVYFNQRHLQLTNCMSNNQIACYCIYHPKITQDQRQLIVLHFQIVDPQFYKLLKPILNTFFKYLLTNDPTQKLYYLKNDKLLDPSCSSAFTLLKNYAGTVESPIKWNSVDTNSYLFLRKEIVCNKNQEYTTIFNTISLFINSSQSLQVQQIKNKQVNISKDCMSKMNMKMKSKSKKFLNSNQLEEYLKEQNLPIIRSKINSDLYLVSSIWEDCLVNARFYVHSKYFYFTVQPPYSYYYQNKDVYYFLISTYDRKKFFLLADKLYEEDGQVDLVKDFKENIAGKPLNSIFKPQKSSNKIISCPLFKKQVEIQINQQSSALLLLQLNWKEYIKGVRYYREEMIHSELLCPFLCAFMYVDQNGIMQQQYSALIQEHDLIQ